MIGCGEDLDKVSDAVNSVLFGGSENASQDTMGVRAIHGFVTSAGFADNDGRAERAFRGVVGGVHAVVGKKGEEMLALLAQAFGEASVVRVGEMPAHRNQRIELAFDPGEALGKNIWGELRLFLGQKQSGLKDLFDGA